MLGVAVVGTGHWGKNHARVYRQLKLKGLVDTVKICDSDESCLRKLSSTLEIPGESDYHQILADPEIKAVSIVTPSHTHYSLGRKFIEAGKDILVEKPMTTVSEDARKLVKLADKASRILMVGHIFRYHPAINELKRRLETGELGEIQNIFSQRLHFGLPRPDMGVIHALGVHELDMFCYLLNRDYPDSLTAVISHSLQSQLEETAALAMDFGNAKGYALESWLLPAYGKKRDLVVVGSKKSALVDYLKPQELVIFDTRIVVTQGGKPFRVEDEGKHIISLPFAEPLEEELKHFVSCVESRSTPVTDGLVGWRAAIMAEAALKSAKSGRQVKFNSTGHIEG